MNQQKAHILIFPYPSQGHMVPLLNFTHQLSIRGLDITILITPKNLHLLSPILSENPSIQTLVCPFPEHPSIPAGVENTKDLPLDAFRAMMIALTRLSDPVKLWFHSHPSPPTAIVFDFFLGWTNGLAAELGIPGYVFSPSGGLALSVIFSLWRDFPRKENPGNENELIHFPKLPNSPAYPWRQLSTVYRDYIANENNPVHETIKASFLSNLASFGLVINTVTELEKTYLDHLKESLGHNRVWAVGPILPPPENHHQSQSVPPGSSSIPASEVLEWLDNCKVDNSVVYVCFGTQFALSRDQMEALTSALEKSGVRFILSIKGPTKGNEGSENDEIIPSGFEERVAGRGLVNRGLAPQFANATLIVDELKVGCRVCEGNQTVPDSDKLAGILAKGVGDFEAERRRALEFQRAALGALKQGRIEVFDAFLPLDTWKSLFERVVHEISKLIYKYFSMLSMARNVSYMLNLYHTNENYWIVGFNATKLFCVVCKSPSSFPQTTPKPLLTLLDLSVPLATSDLGAESLENEFVLNNMHLFQVQKKIEEAASVGQDTGSLDDEAFNTEAALDRCILRLIASCCNGDKLVRATELVKLLSMEKSVRGAIKLVTALKLPNLADRFNCILEERLMNEARESAIHPKCNTPLQAPDSFFRPALAESSKQKEDTVSPFPPQRSSFTACQRKGIEEEQSKDKKGKEPIQATKSEKPVEVKSPVKPKILREATSLAKQPEDSPITSNRPSNPFAKKSNGQENSSLLNSLKKIKTENQGKR
ncbi:OLC1v1013980C1 [Oldenlandia corymbosa var. corymbosa]|uniref:OLC1v1013980C1 n=1 Tax=Oldenlandia corymbosa var. corymbosa TaxID=529605 RepID=A0AAV1E1P8_OLDCO|nr:OLC1v1013980C1 [Oldenlandia corymbosa var. corymbosa]